MVKLIRRKRMNSIIANLAEVQDALTAEANAGATRAQAILAEHRHDGHAEIRVEAVRQRRLDRIDRFVVLDDTNGLSAAMTIEFGRKGNTQDKRGNQVTPMKAVAPLRKAFGIEVD